MTSVRVLVLTYEYPPIGGGGGRVAREIAQRLSKRNFEFYVITAHWDNLPRFEIQNGIYLYRVRGGRRYPDRCSILEMGLYLISATMFSLRAVPYIRPHLIHVHFAVPSGPLGFFIKKLYNIPYLITLHGGDVPGFLPEETNHIFRFLYPITVPVWKEADYIIAVSESLKELAEKAYPGVPVLVIPNGVRIPWSSFQNKPKRERVKILFIGRFSKQKNPILFIEAINNLLSIDRNLKDKIEVLMVGDGSLRSEVEHYRKRLGLSDIVKITGWLNDENIDKILWESDILVNTSHIEGFSLSVLQAMASGLAVVATNVPGNREAIQHGITGWLVPSGSAIALASAIYNLIIDMNLRYELGKNAFYWAKKYNWSSMCSQYEEIYKHILRKNGRSME